MCAKIVKSNPEKTTRWSGGNTTELFIFPTGSSYVERDFGYRLSTATVEVETSVFTPLPNVSRVLMVLDGQMNLEHKNEHKAVLSKFDVDRFDGAWKTSSFGKCVDFNLMLRDGYRGDVQGLDLGLNEQVKFEFDERPSLYFYVYKGEVKITLDEITHNLNKGDLLCLEESECFKIDLFGTLQSSLVVVRVI
jgi:environmental stress-induced protein Ves